MSFVVALFAFIVARAFGGLLGRETSGWCVFIARAIGRRAADIVDQGDRGRYREEFAADLAQFDDRPLTMLIVALRIFNASLRLRWALQSRKQSRTSRFQEWIFQRGIRSRTFRLWYYALAPTPLALIAAVERGLHTWRPLQLLPLAAAAAIWCLGATVEVKVLLRASRPR